MEKRYCINCGKELPNEAEFCLYCGAKQATVKADVSHAVQQYEDSINTSKTQNDKNTKRANSASKASTVEHTPAPEKKLKSKKAKRRTKRVWAILMAVVVIFIAVAVHASHNSNSATETATSYNDSSSDSSSTDDSDYDDSDDSDYDDSSDSEDTGDFENKPVKGISAADYDATEAAGNNYSYGELLKSDDYKGESYNITNAQVLQADEDDGATQLLVYTDEYADEIFTVYYPDTTEAVKDDYVTVKGVLGSRENYDTQSGGSNTVPTIVAQDVTVTGQGS